MIYYGKTARCALASLCHLARHYKSGNLVGSREISEAINLPSALVAKILTTVSSHGLIQGTRGPNGGYKLARDPEDINLIQIITLFGQEKNNDDFCPMGPGWCGVKDKCPMHDTIDNLRNEATMKLSEITLADFTIHPTLLGPSCNH